jgi:DNA-directed RNA polymerase specialized sigma24 family protein
MVVNEYLSWRRKWGRLGTSSELVDERSQPSRDVTADVDDRAWLRLELVKLPPRQRAVVVLKFYEGLTDAEIATALRCPRGTVSSCSRVLCSVCGSSCPLSDRPFPELWSPRLVTRADPPQQQEF